MHVYLPHIEVLSGFVSQVNERPRVSAAPSEQVDLTPQQGFSPLRVNSHQLKSTFNRLIAGRLRNVECAARSISVHHLRLACAPLALHLFGRPVERHLVPFDRMYEVDRNVVVQAPG